KNLQVHAGRIHHYVPDRNPPPAPDRSLDVDQTLVHFNATPLNFNAVVIECDVHAQIFHAMLELFHRECGVPHRGATIDFEGPPIIEGTSNRHLSTKAAGTGHDGAEYVLR